MRATHGLQDLAERVRAIECRDGAVDPIPDLITPWMRFPRRVIHEWFSPNEPPLCLLADLAQHTAVSGVSGGAGVSGAAFWIGRRCWPHPKVLGDALDRCLFIDLPTRTANRDRLWAIDLVLRSPAAEAVFADGCGLDMAATRRLQLAAEAGRSFAALVRPEYEQHELSAAACRWLVSPVRSPVDHPRWVVQLLRSKDAAVSHAMDGKPLTVEFSGETGVVPIPADVVDRPAASAQRIA